MGEAKYGDEFITHEFDEAIAIQRAIVDAEEKLGRDHPRREAQQLIKTSLKADQKFLALAAAGAADALVTSDRDLLDLAGRTAFAILTPARLRTRLGV